ncbi:hypothetical protein SAMN05444853_12056 [Pasteurella skyensis]|uniref:Uncharacterized protein n=1 Tax=Phocoenobacter skyensis TaxID=97481 RepID=A0A1H7YU74_9PAST|nr:hypothetical protein SAMN05444853_12056 [Pasteurella skyensis]
MITKQQAQNKIEKLLKSKFKDQIVIIEEATLIMIN